MIGRRLHRTCTIRGARELLVCNGRSCQVPARRAMERDDEACPAGSRRCGGARRTRDGRKGFGHPALQPHHRNTTQVVLGLCSARSAP
ncbi:hypothetical protein [Streptomyces sp. NPDC059918]|uniref:hypothetical protein n=1 Tax=unclassified Streptomyces TaxID=2593676 RepID=UPI0036678D40